MADEVIGTGQGDPAPGGTNVAGQTSAVPDSPTVLDIPDDNTLVRVRGSDKPIKFGDYSRGFQSQATKAAQERARVERELATERQRVAEYEARLKQVSQQASGQHGNQPDVYSQLESLTYLDGPTAAKVVQSIAGQIQNRDRILLGLAQELQRLQKTVGGLNESHVQSGFSSKIDRYLSDGGYGPELKDFASELYLAYEPGPDLDAQFPSILAERVEALTKYVEAKRQASLNAARKSPFVPGRGGQAGPTRPLELDPKASARETADKLWDLMQVGPGT